MQYTAIFLALLAAAGARAAPQSVESQGHDRLGGNEVRVILTDTHGKRFPTSLTEPKNQVSENVRWSNTFQSVEIRLGDKVKNKELRCQILDHDHKPIIAKRGANKDKTFADGGKGPWTILKPTTVTKIICDQDFKKIGEEALKITVTLKGKSQKDRSVTTFVDSGRAETKAPNDSRGPFETVLLDLGELVDPAFRCAILDKHGDRITVIRGQNTKQTFGDGDLGAWTLKHPSEVYKITCDPTFKA